MFLLLNYFGVLTQEHRIQANKRISCHCLMSDGLILGNLHGLLEQGVQVDWDREEEHDDALFMSIGYTGSVGTCLWQEIKND
jgi:hypothetical protein